MQPHPSGGLEKLSDSLDGWIWDNLNDLLKQLGEEKREAA
jgi:hypothetical protein